MIKTHNAVDGERTMFQAKKSLELAEADCTLAAVNNNLVDNFRKNFRTNEKEVYCPLSPKH